MITQQQKLNNVSTLGETESLVMDIDTTNKRFIMDLLSEGIYKDSVGSLTREVTSNSLDSTRESGSTEPVVVSLTADKNGDWWFRSTDKGVGISPERMDNVIRKFFCSTKRDSADQIGMMGLGFKSPMAYRDSFNIITVYDRILYKYMMYKSEEGASIDLLYSEETTEPNGTTIEVSVRRGDVSDFERKIKEQLCYFENVYFDVRGISNDFKIIKTEHWKYSELSQDRHMHLCLDNVYYPLDFSKLGIKAIDVPVALNFTLTDGIIPLPNREDIRYTKEAKEKILAKIKLVSDYFIKEYNSKVADTENILDIWDEIGNNYPVLYIEDDFEVSINEIKTYSSIPLNSPKVKGAEDLDLVRFKNMSAILLNYLNFSSLTTDGRTKKNNTGYYRGDAVLLRYQKYNYGTYDYHKVLVVDEQLSGLKKMYLKEKFPNCIYMTPNKDFKRSLKHGSNSYYILLNLKNTEPTKWRTLVNQCITLEKAMYSSLPKTSDITIEQSWLDARKNSRKKAGVTKVDKVEINPKMLYEMSIRRMNRDYAFKSEGPVKVDNLSKTTLYLYSGEEDKDFMSGMASCLKYHIDRKEVNMMILVNRDIERIQNLTNFINLKTFMEGKHQIFKDYVTSRLINNFSRNNQILFNNKDFISKIDSSFIDLMTELEEFAKPHARFQDDEVEAAMIEVANTHNLWNDTIKQKFDTFVELSQKFQFLKFLKHDRYNRNIETEVLEFATQFYNSQKETVL